MADQCCEDKSFVVCEFDNCDNCDYVAKCEDEISCVKIKLVTKYVCNECEYEDCDI